METMRAQESITVQRYYDDLTTGHLGMAKIIAQMARLDYWPGMFQNSFNMFDAIQLAWHISYLQQNLLEICKICFETGHSWFSRSIITFY